MFTSFPMCLAGIIGLINSQCYDEYVRYSVTVILGLLSICNQLVSKFQEPPTVIIDASRVYKLTQLRLEDNKNQYDRYIGEYADASSIAELPIEEQEEIQLQEKVEVEKPKEKSIGTFAKLKMMMKE